MMVKRKNQEQKQKHATKERRRRTRQLTAPTMKMKDALQMEAAKPELLAKLLKHVRTMFSVVEEAQKQGVEPSNPHAVGFERVKDIQQQLYLEVLKSKEESKLIATKKQIVVLSGDTEQVTDIMKEMQKKEKPASTSTSFSTIPPECSNLSLSDDLD
jgi:hypothetical protein